VLLCLTSLLVVCASMVLVRTGHAGADTVAGAKAKAAAIAATLAAAQNKMSALGQQYDAARTQLSTVNSDIAATKAAIVQKQQEVSHDTVVLRKAAITNYISDGTAATANPLFSTNAKTQGAASEYNEIASGDLHEEVANLDTTKAKLNAQQAQLNFQQKQAQAAVAAEQQAVAANQLVEQQQSAALAQENSEIATLVQQQQEAEQAAAAKAAQEQIEAAEAAQAKALAAQSSAPTTRSSSSSSGGSSSTTPARTSYAPVPVAQGAAGAVTAAQSQLGVPYVWGGPVRSDHSGERGRPGAGRSPLLRPRRQRPCRHVHRRRHDDRSPRNRSGRAHHAAAPGRLRREFRRSRPTLSVRRPADRPRA
jgi:septal ring factor EnvC (AmiA/AmiB activator)